MFFWRPGWGSGTVQFPYLVTPLDGITSRAGEEVEVVHTFDDWDEEGAAELAKDADIALVFSMTKAGEEYIMVDGNHDRKNLSLWNNGDNLVKFIYQKFDIWFCIKLFLFPA